MSDREQHPEAASTPPDARRSQPARRDDGTETPPPATRRNAPLLCAFHALQMSLFPIAVITIFFRREIGMSMTEIFLAQAVFGLFMAVFEFPSGYVADRMGYRRSLQLGAGMALLAWVIYSVADTLGTVIVAEAVLGIAWSLVSGSDSALLYESLVDAGREVRFGHWSGWMRFWGQLSEGTAAIAAGFLFALSPRLPFQAQVLVWAVALVIAWSLVEPERHRPPATDNWAQVKGMLRHALVDSPRLRSVILTTVVLGLSSFIPVWTIQLYAVGAGVPEAALGILWAVANYTVALGSLGSSGLKQRIGTGGLVLACVGLIAAGYLGMALVSAVWGVAFYLCLTLMRGLFGPALLHEENRLVPSGDRAGFLSLRSLIFRASFLVIGPAAGIAIDAVGQRPVLLVLALLLPAAALLALGELRRRGVA